MSEKKYSPKSHSEIIMGGLNDFQGVGVGFPKSGEWWPNLTGQGMLLRCGLMSVMLSE